VLLRRAFLVGAAVWAAAFPLAAFAASRPAGPSIAYAFALVVYAIGHVVCHQLPVRSFHLWTMTLPVCARCTGIYVGTAATAMAMSACRWRPAPTRGVAHARVVFLLSLVPTAATLLFEWTTGGMPAHWIRALAGLPLGAAVAWAIGMVN
jgi:uncharacterized membrane protein